MKLNIYNPNSGTQLREEAEVEQIYKNKVERKLHSSLKLYAQNK